MLKSWYTGAGGAQNKDFGTVLQTDFIIIKGLVSSVAQAPSLIGKL